MKLTNKDAETYYNNLMSISDKITGKFAYIVSRNIRKLNTELKEYLDIKNDCIKKYGEEGEDGIYSLRADSPKFNDYLTEMSQYDNIDIEVDIMKVNSDVICESPLTASEMLLVDFMIEE